METNATHTPADQSWQYEAEKLAKRNAALLDQRDALLEALETLTGNILRHRSTGEAISETLLIHAGVVLAAARGEG